MIVMRLVEDTSTFHEELKALRRQKGSCDEVWLGHWGYFTLEEHEKRARQFGKNLKEVNDCGFRGVFELGANLGHVPELSETEVTKNFRKMVGMHGEQMPGAFCPRGEVLLDFQRKVVKKYMRYKPYAMMIDDDMRLEFRNGIGLGCFCDECIRLFNEKRGTNYGREEIAENFLTDPAFRKAYIAHNLEGLADYASALTLAAKEVAPDALVGYENCFLGGQNGGNLNAVWKAMHEANGKPLISRAGAFYYRDVSPRDVLDKVLNNSYVNSILPSYVSVRRPEIENTDNTVMGKSVRGTLMEAELNLALGMNGLSFHMSGQECEPVSVKMRYFEALKKERKYLEEIGKWAAEGRLSGLHPVLYEDAYLAKNLTKKEAEKAKDSGALTYGWSDIPKERGRELWQIGLPLSYEDDRAFLLHEDMVPFLTEEEINDLLQKPILTSGTALLALKKRGHGLDFPVKVQDTGFVDQETFPENELIGKAAGRGHVDGFTANRFTEFFPQDETRVTVLGKEGNRITSVLCETARGGKWGVIGSSLFNIFVNTEKRDFLLRLADALTGGMGCRLLTAEQAVVLPRTDGAGNFTGAFLHSITISYTRPLFLAVKKPATERFFVIFPNGTEQKLSWKKSGGEYLIQLPPLPPYQSELIVCK